MRRSGDKSSFRDVENDDGSVTITQEQMREIEKMLMETHSESLKHLVDKSRGFPPNATVRKPTGTSRPYQPTSGASEMAPGVSSDNCSEEFSESPLSDDTLRASHLLNASRVESKLLGSTEGRERKFVAQPEKGQEPRSLNQSGGKMPWRMSAADHLRNPQYVEQSQYLPSEENSVASAERSKARKPKFQWYAVYVGRAPGIYSTWRECKEQTDEYPGARFKGFQDREEAMKSVREHHETRLFNESLRTVKAPKTVRLAEVEESPISHESSPPTYGREHLDPRTRTPAGSYEEHTPRKDHRSPRQTMPNTPADRLRAAKNFAGTTYSSVDLKHISADIIRMAEENGLAYLVRTLTEMESVQLLARVEEDITTPQQALEDVPEDRMAMAGQIAQMLLEMAPLMPYSEEDQSTLMESLAKEFMMVCTDPSLPNSVVNMEWSTLSHLYRNLVVMVQVHCEKVSLLTRARALEEIWQRLCEDGVQSVMVQDHRRRARIYRAVEEQRTADRDQEAAALQETYQVAIASGGERWEMINGLSVGDNDSNSLKSDDSSRSGRSRRSNGSSDSGGSKRRKKAKPKRGKAKAKAVEPPAEEVYVKAGQMSPTSSPEHAQRGASYHRGSLDREMNTSGYSRGIDFTPEYDARGRILNLHDFLETAKTRTYRDLCEAVDAYSLEGVINERCNQLLEEYIDQQSATWPPEVKEAVRALPVVKWVTRTKMTPPNVSGVQKYDYEAPMGNTQIKVKSIQFLQYIGDLHGLQSMGSWTVNVLTQQLSNGTLLSGEARRDFLGKVRTMAAFKEELPSDGDIVSSLFLYYRKRIAQCLAIGRPAPAVLLGEILSEVTWAEGADANTAQRMYQDIREMITQQSYNSAERLRDEVQRQTKLTRRGIDWWNKVKAVMTLESNIYAASGRSWVISYEILDAAVARVYEDEVVEEGLRRSASKSATKSKATTVYSHSVYQQPEEEEYYDPPAYYQHALRTESESGDVRKEQSSNAPAQRREWKDRQQESPREPREEWRERGRDNGRERSWDRGRSYSPNYGRGYDRRRGSSRGDYQQKKPEFCDRCQCHHLEEGGDRCPFRPKDGPKEFNQWDIVYVAGLPRTQAQVIEYRMSDIKDRSHAAYLEPSLRDKFWKKVAEMRK